MKRENEWSHLTSQSKRDIQNFFILDIKNALRKTNFSQGIKLKNNGMSST
jgi:hypothetical protein